MAAVRILCAGNPGREATAWVMAGPLSSEAKAQKERLEREAPGVSLVMLPEDHEGASLPLPLPLPLPPPPADTGCIIDALFGTGLSREVTGQAAGLCRIMEEAYQKGVPVVAVDIPSGLHGETGQIMGAAVRATETVTFHRPKPGLYLGQGPDLAGRVTVAPLGIPPERDEVAGFWILEEGDLPALLGPRPKVSHKGSFGRALVVAGSEGMAGAAAICALAALRTGAGLVTVACPREIVPVVQTLCPCATCLPLPTGDPGLAGQLLAQALEKADAVAIGPGLGTDGYAKEMLEGLLTFLRQTDKPAVLDADGLNLLAEIGEMTEKTEMSENAEGREPPRPLLGPHQILTPHPGEAARLLGLSTVQVMADAPGAAAALEARFGASMILKGAASVLLSGGEKGLNILGTPAMAKGGSGDALTGVLVALLAMRAQGAFSGSQFALLQAATGLHGLAGVAAARDWGERGMLAMDLCGQLGRVGSVR